MFLLFFNLIWVTPCFAVDEQIDPLIEEVELSFTVHSTITARYKGSRNDQPIFLKKHDLEKNSIVGFSVNKQDIAHSKSGKIDYLKTIRNHQRRHNVKPLRYNLAKPNSKLTFLPVKDQYPRTGDLQHIALEHLLTTNNIKPTKASDRQIALNTPPTRNLQRFNEYDKSYLKEMSTECCSKLKPQSQPVLESEFLNLINAGCKDYNNRLSLIEIFPEEMYKRYSEEYQNAQKNYVKASRENKKYDILSSLKKIENKCKKEMQQRACSHSPWFPPQKSCNLKRNKRLHLADENFKQRFVATSQASQKIAKEFGVNPYLFTCIGGKETGYLEPMIRTTASCSPKKPCSSEVPIENSSKCGTFQNNYTASGLGQVTRTTIRDLLHRGVISFIENENNPLPHPKFNNLLLELFDGEAEKNEALKFLKSNKAFAKDCRSKKSMCWKLAEKIWSSMPSSIELQAALSMLILAVDKEYRLDKYYGHPNDKKRNYYTKSVNKCLKCIHKKKLGGENELHRCVFRATDDRLRIFENFKTKNGRGCNMLKECYEVFALEFWSYNCENCKESKVCSSNSSKETSNE